MEQQEQDKVSRGLRLSKGMRRVVLLLGGGVLLGLAVVTLWSAVPRQVLVVVTIEGPVDDRQVRTLITSGEETVLEALEGAAGRSLVYDLWLSPQPHRIEISSPGCPSLRRIFTPGEMDRVLLRFRCGT